jgi:hypothetical protein
LPCPTLHGCSLQTIAWRKCQSQVTRTNALHTASKPAMQARGRWKNDYYSDDEEPAAAKAPAKPVANGIAKGKAVANGRPAGKAAKDPVALRRQRLLTEEAEARTLPFLSLQCCALIWRACVTQRLVFVFAAECSARRHAHEQIEVLHSKWRSWLPPGGNKHTEGRWAAACRSVLGWPA